MLDAGLLLAACNARPSIWLWHAALACGVGQMREATGVSLAVGTLMLARKEILTKVGGVYGPEACLEPARFLPGLREGGITAYSDLEMTKPIV